MNSIFNVENVDIPYEIVVNKRLKYMKISMGMEGMKVSIPRKTDIMGIQGLLNSKAKWIYNHYKRLQSMKLPERDWDSRENVFYKGNQYEVVIHHSDQKGAKALFNGEQFEVYVSSELKGNESKELIEEALRKLYKTSAKRIIDERLQYYSKIVGVSYNDVRIKEQKTRWGSCSKKGNLNFNWKIIMAPQWVMDYVIIHELCHLKYLNHSAQYWTMVEAYMPDYNLARLWLKENGMKLNI